jgi:hypothetical protein
MKTFLLFSCGWDCSGEQVLVSEHDTHQEARDAAVAAQSSNPNNCYSIERREDGWSTVVEQLQGQPA